MKKIIWFFIGVFTIAVWYGAFQSGIITGTEFCIWTVCVNDWSVFSRSAPWRIKVSVTNSTFTGLKQAVDWINASWTQSYELLLDAGMWDITDTITLNAAGGYPITILWLWFETTTLLASWGLEGKPMFDIKSPLELNNLNIDASWLAWHGAAVGEDGVKISAAWNFVQIQNVGIYGFNKGISLEADSEMRVFNSALEDNVAYGAYISWGDYRSANTDYNNSAVGVGLHAGSGKFFSSEHDSYLINSWQIGIQYEPATYTNYDDIAIFNDNFKNEVGGIVRSWFDFSLARDADIEAYENIGDEDHRPHGNFDVLDGLTWQSYTSNVWTKVNYTFTEIYAKKRWATTTGRLTYLSNHVKSVQMWVSAWVSTSTSTANVKFAIIKNWITWTQYGTMPVSLDQNARSFNFSQNIYLDDVIKNDYFELYVYPIWANETLILQDLNWLVDSR